MLTVATSPVHSSIAETTGGIAGTNTGAITGKKYGIIFKRQITRETNQGKLLENYGRNYWNKNLGEVTGVITGD